jgi:hypothetical protein
LVATKRRSDAARLRRSPPHRGSRSGCPSGRP